MENEHKSLVAKLAEACDAVGGVEKKGVNQEQRYKYVRAADVAMAIRHELFRRGIVVLQNESEPEYVIYENTRKDGSVSRQVECRIGIEFRITDGTEMLSMMAYSCARDSSDKSPFKAKTGALKYFLRGLGLIPDEKEDPEYDGGRAEEEEPEQKLTEIAGLVAQETESEGSRWVLVVDRDKNQFPVRHDRGSQLGKRLLVGYEAVLRAAAFEKDGRTAYNLAEVLWVDKSPVKDDEKPQETPPSANTGHQAKAAQRKLEERQPKGLERISKKQLIDIQELRKSAGIPDENYYDILGALGAEHAPELTPHSYPKAILAIKEWQLHVTKKDAEF